MRAESQGKTNDLIKRKSLLDAISMTNGIVPGPTSQFAMGMYDLFIRPFDCEIWKKNEAIRAGFLRLDVRVDGRVPGTVLRGHRRRRQAIEVRG